MTAAAREPTAGRERYKPLAFAGVVLLVFCLPIFESTNVGSVLPGVASLLGLLTIGAWLLESLYLQRMRFAPPSVLLVLYFVLSCLSFYWSYDTAATAQRLVALAKNLIFYFIIIDVCHDRSRLNLLLAAYAAGMLCTSGTLVENFVSASSYQGQSGRYSAAGFDPNDYGVMLASALPILLFFTRRSAVLSFAVFLAVGSVIVATGSRSAILGVGFAALYWLWQGGARGTLTRLSLAVVGGLTLLPIVAAALIPADSLRRIVSDSSGGSDVSNGRLDILALGLDYAGRRPVEGWGAGTFVSLTQVNAHNAFASNLVELGLLGPVLWTLLLGAHFGALVRARRDPALRPHSRVVLTALLAISVTSFTLNWEVRSPLYIMWGVALAVWLQADRRDT